MDRTLGDGAIVMSRAASGHLRAALEQMDLLLASKQVDVGLKHLVALLRHLQAFRKRIV